MKQKLQDFLEEHVNQHPHVASFHFITPNGMESIKNSELIKHTSFNTNDYNENVASIVNSSGTGGKLKGILLTHQNIIDVVSFYMQQLASLKLKNILCVLPCYAIYPCVIALATLAKGLTIYFGDAKKIGLLNLLSQQPIECLPLVPLGIATIHANIIDTVSKKGKLKRTAFRVLTHLSRLLRRHFRINVGKQLFPSINKALGAHLHLIFTGGPL